MTLTIHGLTGILIGKLTGNPIFSFFFSVVLHFIFDMIPHDTKQIDDYCQKLKKNKKNSFMALLFSIDLCFFVFVFLILSRYQLFTVNSAIVSGIIGGLLPDFIWLANDIKIINNRFTEAYWQMHEKIHQLLYQKIYISSLYAALVQGAFFIMLILNIFYT